MMDHTDLHAYEQQNARDAVHTTFSRLSWPMAADMQAATRFLISALSGWSTPARQAWLDDFEGAAHFTHEELPHKPIWHEYEVTAFALMLFTQSKYIHAARLIKKHPASTRHHALAAGLQNAFRARGVIATGKFPGYLNADPGVQFLVDFKAVLDIGEACYQLKQRGSDIQALIQLRQIIDPVMGYENLVYHGKGRLAEMATRALEKIKVLSREMEPRLAPETDNVVLFRRLHSHP